MTSTDTKQILSPVQRDAKRMAVGLFRLMRSTAEEILERDFNLTDEEKAGLRHLISTLNADVETISKGRSGDRKKWNDNYVTVGFHSGVSFDVHLSKLEWFQRVDCYGQPIAASTNWKFLMATGHFPEAESETGKAEQKAALNQLQSYGGALPYCEKVKGGVTVWPVSFFALLSDENFEHFKFSTPEIPSEFEYIGKISIEQRTSSTIRILNPATRAEKSSEPPNLVGVERLRKASSGHLFAKQAEFSYFVLSEEGDSRARLLAEEYCNWQKMLEAQRKLAKLDSAK